MTQESEKTSLNDLPQVYDTSFKEWVSEQAPTILPVILLRARYEATLDAEIFCPPMRMDKVLQLITTNLAGSEARYSDIHLKVCYTSR